jgi:transcriptional regulator with XRE-family HTH domain
MEFKYFLKRRRKELDLSQANIADALTLKGEETSYAKVGHWETGRNKPPLIKPEFREALASVLQMDVNEMMEQLGYVVHEDQRSKEAQLAAMIVDQLPQQARELALDYLHTLEKHFAQSN